MSGHSIAWLKEWANGRDELDSELNGHVKTLLAALERANGCVPADHPDTSLVMDDADCPSITTVPSPFATQVGGDHYVGMAIQPAEYCHRNKIGKLEGDVISYMSRWRAKGGVEDLRKARHTIDLILAME